MTITAWLYLTELFLLFPALSSFFLADYQEHKTLLGELRKGNYGRGIPNGKIRKGKSRCDIVFSVDTLFRGEDKASHQKPTFVVFLVFRHDLSVSANLSISVRKNSPS